MSRLLLAITVLGSMGVGFAQAQILLSDDFEDFTYSDNSSYTYTVTSYGLNAVFFENHWNAGSPQVQERYFDNIVVSQTRFGC